MTGFAGFSTAIGVEKEQCAARADYRISAWRVRLRAAQGPCIVGVMWVGFALSIAAAMAANLDSAAPEPCPTEREVEAELVRLGAERGARPEITITDNVMHVVLRSQEGMIVGSREVEAPTGCRERATVAAVFVATWMGIWPEAASGAKPVSPATPGLAVAKPVVIVPPAPPAPVAGSSAEIALAIAGAYDGNAAALGLALSASRALSGGFRAFVAAYATTERDRSVGLATAGYIRPTLEAGPALRIGHGAISAEIGLSGRLGLLIVRGKDLPVTHSAAHATPGGGANVRLYLGSKWLVPFAFASGAYWFDRQTLTLDSDKTQSHLPRWDVAAGLGVLWAPGR